ncbi:sigma-54-dependent Fis family transcriptional regulator [bacterium]|nr:sigma-54-dependent Fis family transcriptional regulator [bacterium]
MNGDPTTTPAHACNELAHAEPRASLPFVLEGSVTLIGSSPVIVRVRKLIETASATPCTTLITGETGVGKSIVARLIHLAHLGDQPFVRVSCGCMSDHLIEAELFGYEKGAFTGAASAHRGVFEQAEGGTLFLDEIATLPPHLQTSLLGVLDDKIIRRIGSEMNRRINVRIIAATNADIEAAVARRRFREDLFHRLDVLRIHVPPLREHREDIRALWDYFVNTLGSHDGRRFRTPDEEHDLLVQYDWPGNVRELRNLAERAILLSNDSTLQPSLLLRNQAAQTAPVAGNAGEARFLPLATVEREHIRHVFTRMSRNYTRAARVLGISLSTLRRKIARYGLDHAD